MDVTYVVPYNLPQYKKLELFNTIVICLILGLLILVLILGYSGYLHSLPSTQEEKMIRELQNLNLPIDHIRLIHNRLHRRLSVLFNLAVHRAQSHS